MTGGLGKVMAIVNQKGGVGKSTTAVNLAAYLAAAGKRTLLLDIDPQGNATSGVGIDKYALTRSIYEVLTADVPLKDVIQETEVPLLAVAPATIDLAGAEVELVATMSREFRLRRALEGVRAEYDYCLIDSPPSLGLLALNGLTAADSALVPIQCEFYALEGLSQLVRTLQMVRQHLNPDLMIEGVVLTMFDARTNLSEQVVADVRNFFEQDAVKRAFGGKAKVFNTLIPRNVRLSEAPSFGKPIILYDDRSRGAEAYRDLAREVMGV